MKSVTQIDKWYDKKSINIFHYETKDFWKKVFFKINLIFPTVFDLDFGPATMFGILDFVHCFWCCNSKL